MRIIGYVMIFCMLFFSMVMSTEEGGSGSGSGSGAVTEPIDELMQISWLVHQWSQISVVLAFVRIGSIVVYGRTFRSNLYHCQGMSDCKKMKVETTWVCLVIGNARGILLSQVLKTFKILIFVWGCEVGVKVRQFRGRVMVFVTNIKDLRIWVLYHGNQLRLSDFLRFRGVFI